MYSNVLIKNPFRFFWSFLNFCKMPLLELKSFPFQSYKVSGKFAKEVILMRILWNKLIYFWIGIAFFIKLFLFFCTNPESFELDEFQKVWRYCIWKLNQLKIVTVYKLRLEIKIYLVYHLKNEWCRKEINT